MDCTEFDGDLTDTDSESCPSNQSDEDYQPRKRRKISSRKYQESISTENYAKPNYWTHLIEDQPSESSTAYHPSEARSRAQSKTNFKSNLIGRYELDEKYNLDDAIAAAQKEKNKNIRKVSYNTKRYRVIKDEKGEAIQQIRYHHSRPESKAFQSLITVIRAKPKTRRELNRERRLFMTRICGKQRNHPSASLHQDDQDSSSNSNPSISLPKATGKRKWDKVDQRIISVDGWHYRSTTDNRKGISLSAVAVKCPDEVRALKSDPVAKKLQEELQHDLNRFQCNTIHEWRESYKRDPNIERTDAIPIADYSGICFNFPKTETATTAVPAHRDVLDGLYDSCTVMAVSLDSEDRSWSPDSYALCFPALKLKIQLGPMDKVIFPLRMYFHFNSGFKKEDPRRASIVFFTHESLLIKLDQMGLEKKEDLDRARKEGMTRRKAAFLNPGRIIAGPSFFASEKEKLSRKQQRKINKKRWVGVGEERSGDGSAGNEKVGEAAHL